MSTTTTVTTKTLKTTEAAEPIKTIKTIARTTAKGEVTQDEAANLAPGTAKMTTRTVTETTISEKPEKTATFREGLEGRYFFLLDITHAERDKVRMEENLIEHVKDTILILEARLKRTIGQIYIGKTYVGIKDGQIFDQIFDRLDHRTWTMTGTNTTMKGINDRWSEHQKNSEGMVVLCAFTREDLPAGSRRSQEHLAVAMEQRLIHHFQIFDTEKLTVNKSFNEGGTTKHTKDNNQASPGVHFDYNDLDHTCNPTTPPSPTYCAYVIYMTFSFLPHTMDELIDEIMLELAILFDTNVKQ